MWRPASHSERDLERRPHRDRVRAPALVLHEAGKFPAAGCRDFVDAGDPALPAPPMDLLTRKEWPFAVAEGPLGIGTSSRRLFERQVTENLARVIQCHRMEVTIVNLLARLAGHAALGHGLGIKKAGQQVLSEPPRE